MAREYGNQNNYEPHDCTYFDNYDVVQAARRGQLPPRYARPESAN